MAQLIAFLAGSILLLAVSWGPLRDPHSHGFYRFFAWEALLGLTVLNAPVWFRDPFSPLQIISWLMLLLSILLAIHGFWLLGTTGKPEGQIENTTILITRGAYRYIRHPLYASFLWFGWGAFCKQPSLAATLLTLVTMSFLVATAKVEESELVQKFGDAYRDYMKQTKMFIPYFF